MRNAAVFPGQGSQVLGMGRSLGERSAEAREAFDTASAVLGWDLWDLCTRGPAEGLSDTSRSQPAIFTVSHIMFRLLADHGWQPDLVTGHSLGEFTAAVAAGALSFQDGLRTVAERGRFMARAAARNPGAMLALLGVRCEELPRALADLGRLGMIAPANYNCPGQVVVALERKVLEAAKRELAPLAKRVVELPVSGGFHSPLMEEAQREFARFLAQVPIQRPRTPILLNVRLAVSYDPTEIRDGLVAQMTAPVRWEEAVQRMTALGVGSFVEVGPRDVLTGLVRRIAPQCRAVATDGRDPQEVVSELGRGDGG